MEKFSKEDIQFIDNYLIKLKVKYIDVRIELIDHLASEFETNSNYVLLEDYLKSKREFIDLFVKNRQKTVHWSYQRQLWKRFFMFFYKPKYIFGTLVLFAFIYFSLVVLNDKIAKYLFIFSLAIINFLVPFYQIKKNKIYKKIQSAQSLFAIMALPSLFFYCFFLVKSLVFSNLYLFFGYWFLVMIFNISGLIEVYKRKNEILKKYSFLINN